MDIYDDIREILEPQGFWMAYGPSETFSLSVGKRVCYTRISQTGGCFEKIILDLAGGPVVEPLVSILPGSASWNGTSIGKRVQKLPTSLRSKANRSLFLEHLQSKWPNRCAELASKEGPSLLAKTAKARSAAAYYLENEDWPRNDLRSYWNDLKQRSTTEEQQLAKFSLRTAVLSLRWNSDEDEDRAFCAYQVASYLVTLKGKNAALLGHFGSGTDPYVDRDFAFCLQIMACCLFGERGCEQIDFGTSPKK